MSKFCIKYTINNLSVNSDLLLNLSYHKLTNVLRNQNKYNYNAFCNLSLYSIIKVQTSNHNNNAKVFLNFFFFFFFK